MRFPLDAKLKDGTPIQLVLAGRGDREPLHDLYRVIVEEGGSYPHDRVPNLEEFEEYWFRGTSTVAAYRIDAQAEGAIGAFYLKPNWPGSGQACGQRRLYRGSCMAKQRAGVAAWSGDARLCTRSWIPKRSV